MPKARPKAKVITVKKIRKRDGTVVPFEESRIVSATLKAMRATNEGSEKDAAKVAQTAFHHLL